MATRRGTHTPTPAAVARQIDVLISTVEDLQGALTVYKRGLTRLASLLRDRATAPEALSSLANTVGGRPRLVPDVLAAFESERHALRSQMVSLAMSQGMSASDVARRLGVSRQLISRIAREG